MNRFYKTLCLCFVGSLLVGCVSGLQMTDISELKRKDFPTIGVSMEIPGKLERLNFCNSPEFKKKWRGKYFNFSLHPVYPGPLMEPLYLINVRIIYLDKNEYASYQQKSHYVHADDRYENTEFHKEITEFKVMHPNGRIPLRCFRRDFKNEKTGDVILAAITYLDY